MWEIFRKKDPICGMKENKNSGISKHGEWFCSAECLKKYEKENTEKKAKKHGCC